MSPNRRAICGEILTLALAGLLATSVRAQNTVVASTGSGGNWTSTSAWVCNPKVSPCVPSNGAPPGTGYNVEINAGNVLLNNASTQQSVSIDSISNAGNLSIYDGESLLTSGNVVNDAGLLVGAQAQSTTAGVANGSALIVGGNLTNAGALQLGDGVVSGTVTVNGKLDNSNGQINILGGDTTGSQSTLTVAGEAPGTLTGYTFLDGNKGGAALNYQGGGVITQIGKGLFTPGITVVLDGPNASIEAGGVVETARSLV